MKALLQGVQSLRAKREQTRREQEIKEEKAEKVRVCNFDPFRRGIEEILDTPCKSTRTLRHLLFHLGDTCVSFNDKKGEAALRITATSLQGLFNVSVRGNTTDNVTGAFASSALVEFLDSVLVENLPEEQ